MRLLQELGCVEVSEPTEDEVSITLNRESGGLASCREAHRQLSSALGLLDKYASVKDSLFTPRPEVEQKTLMDASDEEAQIELAQEIIGLDEKIKQLSAKEVDKQNAIEALKPWLNMEMPLDFKGTRNTAAVFGSVPAAVELSELVSSISSANECSKMFEVSSDKEQHCILVLFHNDGHEAVMEALRTYWFSQMSLTGMSGTAAENSKTAVRELAELGEEKIALAERISAKKPQRDELKLAIDRMTGRCAQAEAVGKLLSTPSTIVLEGWIPADTEEKLTSKLEGLDCAWRTEDPDPDKPEEVPVKLSSNIFTEPMTALTEMYSLPAYNGIDPNPFLLPFFPVYFGIMFADLGYGILLALGGLFMRKKMHARGTMKHFSGLMIESGIMAAIFGALTGGFFGDAPKQIAAMMGFEFSMPALIDPLSNPFPVLIAALVIGLIQMLFAVCINGYMLVRDRQMADAFWEVAPIFVVLAGIALGAMGITWWLAIVGTVMVVYAQGRASESIGGKIGNGLYGLYSFASGWFGDILSYSRLMALMLAGSVVAQVFNTLGAMGGPILFVIVFLVGHALNIALNLIGCFVHAVRLQYLEYFGKFYREGGRAFAPLTLKTKYVDIKED